MKRVMKSIHYNTNNIIKNSNSNNNNKRTATHFVGKINFNALQYAASIAVRVLGRIRSEQTKTALGISDWVQLMKNEVSFDDGQTCEYIFSNHTFVYDKPHFTSYLTSFILFFSNSCVITFWGCLYCCFQS